MVKWITLPGLVDYQDGIKIMEDQLLRVTNSIEPNTIFLLEHKEVYTAGTSHNVEELLKPDSFPVIYTGRGGKFTYHGPGQRVIYPIINLNNTDKVKDLKLYITQLEKWIILTLAELDVNAFTIQGKVGIWVKNSRNIESKIGAIGIRVRKWVTYHGVSINLNPDFSAVLADKHAILNLNTLLSSKQKHNYLPVTLESCSLKNTQFLFGLPWYLTSQVTYYNQQLLQQAGWKTPPRSDAELLQLAKDLKQKNLNDVTAFYPTLADNGKFLKQLWQRGLDSPKGMKQYLLFWKTMLDNNLLPQESITMKYQDTVDRYQSGASVLLMSGTTAVKGLQENAPQIYKQTRVMPQFPANSSNVDFSVMTLVVPKQSGHPKEAVDLAAFMTNPQNTFAFSRLAPILPPGPSLKRSEFLFPKSNDLQSQAIAMSARQVLRSKHGYEIGNEQKAKNDATDFYVQSVLLNRMSVDEAAHQFSSN